MEKVAIYCRLSDEDKDKISMLDDSESIQNQKSLLTKYAVEKGWHIYKIYSDDDYSGLNCNRPEFKQMILDAQAYKFNIILCKHQSRFSRDIEVVEKYLHRKFPEWRIRFVSVTDHVDTLEKDNKKSRQINSLVNEWYCEDISESIRATFKTKREDGKFIGSFAPYGYTKDKHDNNHLVVDEVAAQVIRKIFYWYLEGNGTQHIAHMLNEKGIPNPSKYKQEKGLKYKNSSQVDSYGLWNKTTIRRMLRDESYIGNVVQGKKEKASYKSDVYISKPRSKWIVVKNTHEPIIEHEIFYAIQKRLSSNIRSSGIGEAYIFAGKVKCMDCKNTMNKVRCTNGTSYLRCKLYARDSKKKLCSSHSIRLDILQKLVSENLRKHFLKVSDEKISRRLNEKDLLGGKINLMDKQLKDLEKHIKEKDNIIKNLYMDKVNSLIDHTQFNDLNENFNKDKAELIKRQDGLKSEIGDIKVKIENHERLTDVIYRYKNFIELTHAMVNQFIDHIEIGEKTGTEDQKLIIHWNF